MALHPANTGHRKPKVKPFQRSVRAGRPKVRPKVSKRGRK